MSRPVTFLALAACALSALSLGAADYAGEDSVTVEPMPANLGPIQPPAPPALVPSGSIQLAPGQVIATPEMWFYEQEMRRYDDPKAAVRARAEQRADARQARLTALKWFGYSNARPQASPTPFMGTYSPAWTGNHADGYRWVGSGSGPTIIQADRSYGSRY